MTSYYIGADYCGLGEGNDMRKIAEELRKLGHSVTVGGIGPNQEGVAHGVSKSKTFLYLVCGVPPATIWSFKQAIAAGSIPKTIFIHSGWTSTDPNSPLHSENQMLSYSFIPEHDAGQFMSSSSVASMKSDAGSANTVGEYCLKYSKYVGVLWASSPEEAAKKLHNGQVTGYGGGGVYNGSGSNSKSGYSTKSTSEDTSATSPLLNGEMTFQELIGEICKGVDITFLCKRSTVYVADFMDLYAEAINLREKHHSVVRGEDISLWQLEEDSYELNVDHHGFYNTVIVVYKNGMVKESFADFVQIYGEISVTYYEKKLDKTSAIMKAKAYLAAHVRDFELTVQATILSEPDIDIGDMVTLNNPKTNNNDIKVSQGSTKELLFVKGLRTEWEGDGMITSDLELQYAPTSPDRKEVPTAGIYSKNQSNDSSSSSSGGSSDSDSFNKYGVSKDGTKIMAIGRPSSSAESSKYSYDFYKSIFKRKCPFCGSDKLFWSIFYAGNETSNWGTFPATGQAEGGSAEGHIFCASCDADFSCILGADHESPPRAKLERISGPTKCSKQDAYNLKNGKGG